MSYILRVEIELDPLDAQDDVAARLVAKSLLDGFGFDLDHVKVKLQKREPSAPPRAIKL